MPRIPRKRPIDYILPFLIMICAGVIVVLGYNLWSSLQTPEEKEDVYLYTANGSSKILTWGSGEWNRAYTGTRLLQGDSIKTQKGGRIVIELFEDHYIRMDERTEISISEIKESGDAYEVGILLEEGKVWINSDKNSETPVKFKVRTGHTAIQTVSTIYEVEQNIGSEVIRVMNGEVLADIFVDEADARRKVETIAIGVGQEAVITDKDLQDYASMQSPSVIHALSDEFKESSFYKWNYAEDKSPTDYSLKGGAFDDALLEDSATDDAEVTEDVGESDLPKPVITTPSSNVFTTPESSLTLRGTTSAMTQKMMVDVTSGNDTQTYELNLYVTGGSQWSFAISEAGGTMEDGTNIYKFYAIDEEELKSATATVTVVYEGDGITTEDEDDEDEDSEDDEEDEEVGDLGDFIAPEVLTYNGGESNEFDEDGVSVSGSVEGAEKVLVNGYQLTAFEPGDTTWTFYAKESIGNLSDGENTYNVVAYAPDGSTKSATALIVYDQPEPEEEEVVEDPEAEDPAADTVDPVDETPTEEPTEDSEAPTTPKPLVDTTAPSSTPASGEPDASDPAA
jgi:FecR protein